MKRIYPLLSLQQLNGPYAEQLKEAAVRVIESGWYLHGAETDAFEREMGAYLGCSHVVGVGNGLDALRLIFKAYIELGQLQEGDEVIVPANTFMASILSLTDNGLIPRFVEPSEQTHNLDMSRIEDAITPRTKAILVVHLYGRTCWSDCLKEIADRYGLLIVEDNAQAIGACDAGGRHTGTLGDAAGTSFYPGKNLGALGDAGMVTTGDAKVAEMVRTLANYGGSRRYIYEYRGLNSRMDELQAAFLRVKLRGIDDENRRRRELACLYDESIANQLVVRPEIPAVGIHVWHQYVVRISCRDEFIRHLADNGISAGIHYPVPPHLQKANKEYNGLSLPITERLAHEVVSLPIAPYLMEDDIRYIAAVINRFGS